MTRSLLVESEALMSAKGYWSSARPGSRSSASAPIRSVRAVPIGRLRSAGFDLIAPGYLGSMLYTIFIVLAIIALLVFIFGRARV
jgi:hypothetical protein